MISEEFRLAMQDVLVFVPYGTRQCGNEAAYKKIIIEQNKINNNTTKVPIMNLFDKADESRSYVFLGLTIAESLVKCTTDFIGHKAAMSIECTTATREKGK